MPRRPDDLAPQRIEELALQRAEFTQQARVMSDAAAFHAERLVDPFVRELGSPVPERVLDVACGPGIVSLALARAGAGVVGVDVTPAMVERARERARTAGIEGAGFEIGRADALRFPDGVFEAAVTRLSLHHFVDPAGVLAEVRRVLRPGAQFVIGDIVASEDPDEARLHDALETLRDPSHRRLLPERELLARVADAGFRVDRVEALANPKTFEEWAGIVADARTIEPVRTVMRELARAGRGAGIDLREEGDTIRFDHHWRFVTATAV